MLHISWRGQLTTAQCRYYYSHNTGLQAQNVIYTQASLRADPKVFLDPNKFSSDGTVALDAYVFSEDGSLVAYSTGR
jgi:prolyl oligopeptidase